MIKKYLASIDKADREHRPAQRDSWADALVDELRDAFTDEELQAVWQAKKEGRLVVIPPNGKEYIAMPKEKAELMVELPCKVGDAVYWHSHYTKGIRRGVTHAIKITYREIDLEILTSNGMARRVLESVYMSREEAEQALKGESSC